MNATRAHAGAIPGHLPRRSARHGMAALTDIGQPLPGAACAERTNPNDFFPRGTNRAAIDAYARARRACASCPAIAACLQRAIDRGERHGMFGGLTPDERRAIGVPRKGGRRALVAGLAEIDRLGGDADALVDVIARHRARDAA